MCLKTIVSICESSFFFLFIPLKPVVLLTSCRNTDVLRPEAEVSCIFLVAD